MPKNSQAKARALRLPLDSYSRDRLAWFRNLLTAAALFLAMGWLIAGHSNREARYSPGPISNVHDHLNCESCHSGSAPIRDTTFLASLIDKEHENELWYHEMDMLCQTCHPVSGTSESKPVSIDVSPKISKVVSVSPHSANQKNERVGRCVSCHSEHNGVDFLPSQVDDQSCIDCHKSIEEFRQSNKFGIADVTRFGKDSHPEFTSLKSDPGRLKFSHEFHMTPGLCNEDDRESLAKRPGDYPRQTGQLGEYVNEQGLIELDCSFCHQPIGDSALDLRNFVATTNESLSIGKYMSMPNYEQHCRVCHSIDLVPNQTLDEENNPRFNSRFEVPELRIEHGLSAQKTADALNVYFALEFIADPEVRKPFTQSGIDSPQQIPIRLWNLEDPRLKPTKNLREDLEIAENEIRKNCLHCHFETDNAGKSGIPEIQTVFAFAGQQTTDSVIESVWFKHGKFDHLAHRDVQCVECHTLSAGKTQLVEAGQDLDTDMPMIHGLLNCLKCHTTEDVPEPFRRGPTNCISCHTYHGGGNR